MKNKQNKNKIEIKSIKDEFADFVNHLKSKKIIQLSDNELTKEVINWFSVVDYRVIKNKKNILVALELLKVKSEPPFFEVIYCLQ